MNSFILPDIAAQTAPQSTALEWVGMCGIALPLQLNGQRLSAVADAGVSLDDPQARGIHMSRLYVALERLESTELTPANLRTLLQVFLDSHAGLSKAAYVSVRFQHLLKRPALISPLAGWKQYPIEIHARRVNGMFHVELFVQIAYSSTCPCSAALARQLIQERFIARFGTTAHLDHSQIVEWLGTSEGIVATPHSQRSFARIKVRLAQETAVFPLPGLIDRLEAALGTAVQTAVKRADEQAFALANGQNPMFCEDAARRLHSALSGAEGLQAFHLRVEHAESLHAHDAVAESQWRW
ncbi:GTP cyclohydrolase FolE2 [Pseudomonas sp. RP23018S]|uniref:GTP cyclohydrolase FolE2 n=1 Tax=Pseudomonas sp. RP23018S TaxID=3096037 RepID=UPI002ACA3D5B|nr:GTP cyclohydrolase FolE2 [Pseudomonas sp. RP23018S]MDZ5603129.1 GTP cyclohydrolase FolE2 [Pseudomonas sp. RP23018S]